MVESLVGHLYSDQANFSMVALMRGEDRKPFDDDDIAHIERLMPHITRALQLRRAFFRVDTKNLGLQATVDRLRAGIVLLDREGAALFINTAMHAVAQRGDGFVLDRSGCPLPAGIEARQRFDALLEEISERRWWRHPDGAALQWRARLCRSDCAVAAALGAIGVGERARWPRRGDRAGARS